MAKLSNINSVTVVPLSDLTARTKWVDSTICTVTGITSTATVGDTTRFRSYRDSNNKYFLDIILTANMANNEQVHQVNLGGVTFHTDSLGRDSALAVSADVAGGICEAKDGTSQLSQVTVGNVNFIQTSGTVALASKPSWFDANEENTFSIDGRINNATSSQAGLLDLTDSGQLATASQAGLTKFATTSVEGTVKKNTFQNKYLGSNKTSDQFLTDLDFSITPGKVYRCYVQCAFQNNSGDDNVYVNISGMASGAQIMMNTLANTGNGQLNATTSYIFTANASTFRVLLQSATANAFIRGNGTAHQTWAQLEEINNSIEGTVT